MKPQLTPEEFIQQAAEYVDTALPDIDIALHMLSITYDNLFGNGHIKGPAGRYGALVSTALMHMKAVQEVLNVLEVLMLEE